MNLVKMYVVMFVMLFNAAPASAISNLTLGPFGENSFLLQGVGLESAGAVECTITYDAASLGNPRVDLGGLAAGAMMAVNPNTPGTLRIALIRTSPMVGSGVLATINFDRKGEAAGRILALVAKLVTIDGKSLAVAVSISNPTDTTAQTATLSPMGQEMPGRITSPPGMVPSGQTMPALIPFPVAPAAPPRPMEPGQATGDDLKGSREMIRPPDKPVKDPITVAKKTDGTPPQSSRGIYTQKSVLERFSEYRGEPTVPAYIAMFETEEMIGFKQDPPVAVTDGKTVVRITFISASSDRKSSDIAVMGAQLLSLTRDPNYSNTFIIDLLPTKGEYQASVSVPQDGVLMVFPLTLTPKIPLVLTQNEMANESSFKAFLKDRGTKAAPKHDLNGDGRRDYRDDYLYTANYLAARNQARDRQDKK